MRKKQNRVQFIRPQESVLNAVERWGDDVDTAVKFALEELKANIEEVEVLTTPFDLADYKQAITDCLYKGTKRNIESEENSKNVEVE